MTSRILFRNFGWKLFLTSRNFREAPLCVLNSLWYYQWCWFEDVMLHNSLNEEHCHQVHSFVSSVDILHSQSASDITLSPSDSQLLLWREVFIQYEESSQYEVYTGRTFLLVVRLVSASQPSIAVSVPSRVINWSDFFDQSEFFQKSVVVGIWAYV